jgi:hypothetical protein
MAGVGGPRRGPDAGFDRDMQNFLIDLEMSAKTIVKVRATTC